MYVKHECSDDVADDVSIDDIADDNDNDNGSSIPRAIDAQQQSSYNRKRQLNNIIEKPQNKKPVAIPLTRRRMINKLNIDDDNDKRINFQK